MTKEPIAPEGGADPLSRLVGEQAGGKPAPAPNVSALIAEEFNPTGPEQFDPSLHELNAETGGPVFNADGTMRRKRGRRPGQSYGRPGDGEAAGAGGGEPIDPAPPISPAAAIAEAKLAAAMTFGTLESLFGPEWEPETGERDQITEALADYIRTTGGFGLPPWATVALAFGSYAVRRTKIGRMVGLTPPAAAPAPEGEPGADSPAEPMPMTIPVPHGTAASLRPPAVRAGNAA